MTPVPPESGSSLERRLTRELRGEARFDRMTRGLYATDASIYQIRPRGVVLPRTPEDVTATLAAAREEGVSVTPRGAGTSLAGQAIGDGLVVDVSRYLNRVLAIDPVGRTATVEPGVVLDDLNRALAKHGLFFPVDVATSSRATLGGMAANNSSGARSIRYGIMADHVRVIDAVLSDGVPVRVGARGVAAGPAAKADARARGRLSGLTESVGALRSRESDELDRRVPPVLRHVAGYNLQRVTPSGDGLAEILVGSEGTLAFFTRLELALAVLPACRGLAVCHFPTLRAALDAVQHIVGLDPSAVELTDGTLMGLARQNPEFRDRVERFTRGEPAAQLFVEFSGDEPAAVASSVRDLRDALAGVSDAGEVVPVLDPAGQADVWAVRRAGLSIVMSGRSPRRPVSIIEDCTIPLERLAEWGDRLTGVFTRHGVQGTWYAHASVGCLHVRPSLDLKDAADVVRLREIAEEAHEIVRELGGSHSGEHGDGLIRSEFIEPMLGARLARAFEDVKDAFDPDGLLNPGKIVRPPRMDDRDLFRYRPGYGPLPVVATLDWSADGGLLAAVERCNNNGACRKREPGVMCPSYRVTGDERDTTRGRANALRLALTGQLRPDTLSSEELYGVMELCVGCKACRRECPTGVDMSRLKTEFLAQYRTENGIGVRDRAFAHLPRLAPRIAPFASLANLAGRRGWVGALRERVLGISARRSLPRWARRPFRAGETGERASTAAERGTGVTRERVVLFADTFNRWFEPENLRAAVRVLRAAGCEVVEPSTDDRPLCCGRTFLSAGLVEEARTELERSARALAPFLAEGIAVVGLEPSCLLTFRDEAAALLPPETATRLAESTYLIEELLLSEPAAGRIEAALEAAAGQEEPASAPAGALVHGHCHQKAFGIEDSVTKCLSLIPGFDARAVTAGCCGMAGSFGYEAEHVQWSEAMAELGILPAVRGAPATQWIVADGFSCRHQVAELTGRRARHAVRVLDAALDGTASSAPASR